MRSCGCVFPFGRADHVARVPEPRPQALAVAHRGAAEMIEMEVRGQHHVDRIGRQASVGKRMIEVTCAVESIDVEQLRIHLVAGAAVDQHPPPVRFDDERTGHMLRAICDWVRPQQVLVFTHHRSVLEACRLLSSAGWRTHALRPEPNSD